MQCHQREGGNVKEANWGAANRPAKEEGGGAGGRGVRGGA